jgi:hypothetical protein
MLRCAALGGTSTCIGRYRYVPESVPVERTISKALYYSGGSRRSEGRTSWRAKIKAEGCTVCMQEVLPLYYHNCVVRNQAKCKHVCGVPGGR